MYRNLYGVNKMSTILNQVSKNYGANNVILNSVSAEIETGEFFVIVGPSGCGKSTLLRMIAGLTEISDGEISIDGQVVNDLQPKDRKLTMVFQSYALFPFLNVWDNVAFGLKARKLDQAEVHQRVNDALDMVSLSEFKDRKPRELSGGQRQRVALARAVASDAKICLMDEPLSNLDAQLRVKMRQEIYQLQRKLGITLIYVTHDQVEAMTMADHIMVLNDHEVQQIGTPTEIYQQPANAFVANFFGTPLINVMPAQKIDDYTLNVDGDFEIRMEQKITDKATKIGIRPGELSIEHADELSANATVKSTEFLGDETIVYATTNSGHDIRVLLPGKAVYAAFEKIKISSSNNIFLFDSLNKRIPMEMGDLVNA